MIYLYYLFNLWSLFFWLRLCRDGLRYAARTGLRPSGELRCFLSSLRRYATTLEGGTLKVVLCGRWAGFRTGKPLRARGTPTVVFVWGTVLLAGPRKNLTFCFYAPSLGLRRFTR